MFGDLKKSQLPPFWVCFGAWNASNPGSNGQITAGRKSGHSFQPSGSESRVRGGKEKNLRPPGQGANKQAVGSAGSDLDPGWPLFGPSSSVVPTVAGWPVALKKNKAPGPWKPGSGSPILTTKRSEQRPRCKPTFLLIHCRSLPGMFVCAEPIQPLTVTNIGVQIFVNI